MNLQFVIYSIGKLLQLLSISMVLPAAIAWFEPHSAPFPYFLLNENIFGFIIGILSSFLAGSILILIPRRTVEGNTVREGFAIVTFGWIVLTLFGSLPFFIYFLSITPDHSMGSCSRLFADSFFEIMSGFTTTGATIITNVEVIPQGMLFWRSLTHWLGGMGIVTLVLAVFPAFGVAAYQMFRGEVPGPTAERLKPSLAQTAKILWGVYAALTIIETVLLKLGGMSFLDASCHAFGTMATGGFSTRNASVAAYNSPYIEWVIVVFMFFAGMNFIIHYNIIFFKKFDILRKNHEFRFYALVIFSAVVITVLLLQIKGVNPEGEIARSFRSVPLSHELLSQKIVTEQAKVSNLFSNVRYAAFQVVSLVTTTGFCTADFDVWPGFLRLFFVILMFFGGCAGSTGGGIKMIRIMVVFKSVWREVMTMIQPKQIITVKIAEKTVEEKQVRNILGFFVLFLLSTVFFSLVMSLMVPDFTTAITAVVATICNIGPGLSGVGATENYHWIPTGGKWILSFCMLLGRLELYTVLIAISPLSWRK